MEFHTNLLKGRILALDLGKKRIGLALSDPLGITAQGLPTLQRTTIREDLAALENLTREHQVKLILMGHPLHMSGRESTQSAYTREFAERLSGRTGLEVRLSDERLMRAACAGLHADRPHADRPATPQETGPVCVATDGSVRGKVTGFGWLASSGEYGLMGFRHSRKQIGTKVVLVAELRAITKAVQKFRGREITMLSDSKLAIAMVKRWMAGEFVLPEGYAVYRENGKTPGLVTAQRMIYAERDNIDPLWVKGHQGDFLNEGADALARLASRFVLGGSGLDNAEYHRRAQGLAESFSAAYNSQRSA